MTRTTETLLAETLAELLKLLRRENEERERERFDRELAEIRAKRWGYPVPRRRRKN